MSYVALVYLVFAAISVGLIAWLGRTLSHNGAIFLRDVFEDSELAQAVNRLLVVGFYLFNLGFACTLLAGGEAASAERAIELLARKLGTLMLSLGAMHMLNLLLFHRIRRRARLATEPPVAPSLRVPAPESAIAS